MIIHIDTNTFPASPALYADAAKTKPLPRILPAVELQKGGFAVAFIGDDGPHAGETLYLAASIVGSGVQVLAEWSDDYVNGSWGFDFALTSEALAEEVKKRGSARLLVGIISDDDTERREWQFNTVVYPTASSEEIDAETVESAKNFAELAEQSAKRAQEAQADVAGNAQLAENAKQTATQAANAAIGAADDAETAAESAQEAKAVAEVAKTAAESAKTAAQKAASDAQATLSNVYTKAQIDGVDTGAELTIAMNQAHEWLASVSGKLPPSLYESLLEMLRLWSLNPTSLDFSPYIAEIDRALKDWQDDPAPTAWACGDGSSPYEGVNIDTALVDFKVKKITGRNDNSSRPIGIGSTGVFVFPNVEDLSIVFRGFNKLKLPAYAPKAKLLVQTYRITSFSAPIFANEAKSIQYLVQGNVQFNDYVFAKNADDAIYAFSGCKKLNRSFYFPALSAGNGAFSNTAMSAENISKTLDSLPTWTDGKSHIITFTGSPGASELTQESPSVAAAIAKGWTVEL